MTGLQEQINKNFKGKKLDTAENTPLTYTGICRLLGCSYSTAKRKVNENYFTVSEAIALFELLFDSENLNFEYFKYLFTDK